MKETSPSFIFLVLFLIPLFLLKPAMVFSQTPFHYYKENGKSGLKNGDGIAMIPATYDRLGWSTGVNLPVDDVIGYYRQGWGLISVKNKIITGPRYYSLEAYHKHLIVASIKGRFSNELFFGIINSKGEVLIDFRYHSLKPVHESYIVSERRKGISYYGLLNLQGKPLLETKFTSITYFKDDLFVFTTEDKRKGIISKAGHITMESNLDSIAPAAQTYSLIFQSGMVGAIDTSGNIIHRPLYKKIESVEEVVKFSNYKIFNASHKKIKEFYCDTLFQLSPSTLVIVRNDFYEILNNNFGIIYRGSSMKNLTSFRKNSIFTKKEKFHIVKYSGEPVEPDGFDALSHDDHYLYGKSGNQWKIYNKFGSNISENGFDSLLIGSNNLIPVLKNGYWGYVDHSGKIAIPAKFDEAGRFTGNMAEVDYLGSRRIINQFGEFIGASEYDQVTIAKANTALVTKRGQTDLINYRGEILFQTFNNLSPHFFGYLESTEEGHKGLISHLGEVILYPEYDSISDAHNRRYVIVRQGTKTGFANFKGFWIIPLSEETEDICHVGEGLISIKRNGQFGFVDFGQKLLIANRYEATQPFNADHAAVKLNNKWGFIDKKERLVVQPTFSEVSPFKNGISIVKRDNKYGAIDFDGNEKIKIEFDSIYTTTHDFLLARKENKFGLFNQFGELLLQPSYSEIKPTFDDHFIVKRRNLYGLIDSLGKYSIPLKYMKVVEISKGRYICQESIKDELE
ncbi:MAG: WG repeat-containing protein [Reichenbachiella sp.]|uniref:WG repeat-containing protein n=1 Tax=Reichenbachiella sp. TaxID=2184521 RepID=UPI0032649345